MDPSDIDESIGDLERLILEKGAKIESLEKKIESLEKLITAIEGQIDDEDYNRINLTRNIEQIFMTLKKVASKVDIRMDYDLRYEFAPGPKDPRDWEEPPRDGEEPPRDGEEPPRDGEEPPRDGEEPRGAPSPRSRGSPRGRRNRGSLKKRRTTRVANRKRSKNKRGKK